jgi:hypothetical protein
MALDNIDALKAMRDLAEAALQAIRRDAAATAPLQAAEWGNSAALLTHFIAVDLEQQIAERKQQ